MSHRARVVRTRVALVALFVLTTSGCTQWSVVAVPGSKPLDPASTARYLVTTKSGPTWTLAGVHLRNDSLIGNRVDGGLPTEVAVPVAEIRGVETRKVDGGSIGAVVVGLALLLGFAGATTNFGP